MLFLSEPRGLRQGLAGEAHGRRGGAGGGAARGGGAALCGGGVAEQAAGRLWARKWGGGVGGCEGEPPGGEGRRGRRGSAPLLQ